MTSAPALTDPAEDVPADRPRGQSDRALEFGALGPGVTGTVGVGAVVEFAHQLHRPLEGVKATVPVITEIHRPTTDRTGAVEDVEFPQREVRILGPSVGHPADLRARGEIYRCGRQGKKLHHESSIF